MGRSNRTGRRFEVLGVAVLGLVATLLPLQPAAQAAVAPWTWKRVTLPVSVQPTTSYAIRATCPAGYTAITGGLLLPITSNVYTLGQYRQDDATGSGWSVIFRNTSTSTGTASVVAECVETVDLPPTSYRALEFARDANGYAQGSVSCPTPGDLVLTGGVDWDNTNSSRRVYSSAPDSNAESWFGYGYNPVSGAKLTVDVYCVNPAYVPGYQRVERTLTTGWVEDAATCPLGKRILNGGVVTFGYASYPNLNKWIATSSGGTKTIRAMCINAGIPTVSITTSSPGGSGVTTSEDFAHFEMTGTDPAGYPNSFRCSLDGAAPTACNFGVIYNGLSSGTHQFVTWNATADGRLSGLATYQWTVDKVAPTVTKPKLKRVTLPASSRARWSGSDEHSAVSYYRGAYNIFRKDGSSTGWIQPSAWSNLGRSVRTPDLAQGESVCIAVRAYDLALNVSPWSAPSCTTRPFDDRALTASTGWTRATGSAFWRNTVTRTVLKGETLNRTNVHLNRVGIVATQCAGCGSVIVRVGDTKVGRINLGAATTANRKVRLLPAFGDSTGVVTIKSITSGRQISIDALVVLQGTTTPPT